jgi:hypothetical protein
MVHALYFASRHQYWRIKVRSLPSVSRSKQGSCARCIRLLYVVFSNPLSNRIEVTFPDANSFAPAYVSTYSKELFPVYFKTLLHDDMFFEAVIAFSLAMQEQLHQKANTDFTVSVAIIYHSNKAMQKLRKRLVWDTAGISDVVILTIVLLICVTVSSIYLQGPELIV